MLEYISSAISVFARVIATVTLAVLAPIGAFFAPHVLAPSAPAIVKESSHATSSHPDLPVLVTATSSVEIPLTPRAPAVIPVVVTPVVVVQPVLPVVIQEDVGETVLVAQSIPLLFGGTVHAGEFVPVSYIQITNIGSKGTVLEGFEVRQNGSAPAKLITALTTIDDQGGSNGFVESGEKRSLFDEDEAFVPTRAYFAPGQMRLFTIQARIDEEVASHVGDELVMSVTSLKTDAEVEADFPIAGTTWVIQ